MQNQVQKQFSTYKLRQSSNFKICVELEFNKEFMTPNNISNVCLIFRVYWWLYEHFDVTLLLSFVDQPNIAILIFQN